MAKKSKKQLQAELDRHGRDYELAKARGDKQGMEQAHAKANAVRKQAGWTYDQKTGRTYEKVSPIQKQGRLITSERNIALAKAGANPVRAVKQQPVSTRVPTGAKGKTFGKSYAEEKRNQQEVKRVSEKVNQAWENAKRRQTTARVNQIFSEAAKAQGKPVRQLPQSPAITARKVAETLPGVKQVGEDVRTLRTQREQTLKDLPRGEQALRAAAHGLVGSIGSFGETMTVDAHNQISQFKDFGKDYFTTPFSQLQQNYEEKYAGNKIDPYGFGSRHMRESEYFHDRATRDMGKVGKFLTDTGISIAQNAPTMAASAFNPVAGAALMGASAAGAKSYELQQQGVPASEALSRGLLSGAIEAATEKFSIDHFLKTFNGRGLRDAVKNIARQAGVEASEESASYMLNYLADKAAKDPYATFSVGELLQNAAGGAISGGVFGGVGSVASSVRPTVSRVLTGRHSEKNHAYTAPKNQHIPDYEAQWARYNQMGQNGIPFEQVVQYETATPIDYETAYSAHAAGYNDFMERTAQTAQRILAGEGAEIVDIADAVVSPVGRQVLEEGFGFELSERVPQAVAQVQTVANALQQQRQAQGVSDAVTMPQTEADVQEGRALPLSPEATSPSERGTGMAAEVQTTPQQGTTAETAGRRPGGVVQNEAVRTVNKKTVKAVHGIAERLGVQVEFAADMAEAGSYQNGTIRINTKENDLNKTDRVIRQVFVHELTHTLEESGEYNALSQAILSEIDDAGALSEVREHLQERYAENGHTLDDTALDREVVAWFAEENLFTDEWAIRGLAKKNRSLFQRVRDWLHGLRVKLRGTAEEKFVWRTEQLYRKALDAMESGKPQTLGGSENGQKKNAPSGTQYKFSDHKIPTYEELTAKPDIQVVDIRGRSVGRIAEQRKQFMNSPEAQKLYEAPVINRDTGEPVFITSHTLEHTFSNRGLDQINVGKHIGEIIENAVLTHEEAITHKNENAVRIYTLFGAVRTEQNIQPVKLKVKEYQVSKQRLPKEIQKYFDENGAQDPYASAYDGRVLELESIEKEEVSSSVTPTLTEKSVQGDYPSTSSIIRVADLYDLVNNEYQKYLPAKMTAGVNEGAHTQEQGEQGASQPETRHKVGGSESINDIIARNREQSDTIRKLKRQLRDSRDGVLTDPKQVKGLVNSLLTDYSSRLGQEGKARITAEVQEIFDDIANNTTGSGEIHTRIRNVAREIIEHSAALHTGTEQDYKALKAYLKNTKLTISEQDRADITDYNSFRRSLFGTIDLRNEGVPVDVAYMELTETFGEGLFPSDITHPAEQLVHIKETMAALKPVFENPHSRNMGEATRLLADEIYERFFTLSEHPTRGRQQQRQLEAIRAQANERLREAVTRERQKRDKAIDKIKARHSEMTWARRQRTEQNELRREITKAAGRLSTTLLKPTDTRRVVENGRQTKDGQTVSMKKTVAALLETINLESQYSIDPETGRRIYTGETEGQLTQRTEKFRELRKMYEAVKDSVDSTMVVDPDLLYNLAKLEEMKGVKLGDYTTEQLYTLRNTIRAVESALASENKLFSQMRYKDIKSVGEGIIADNQTDKPRDSGRGTDAQGIAKAAQDTADFLEVEMLTPYHYFNQLGKSGRAIFAELSRARGQYITDTDWSLKYLEELKGDIDTSTWSGKHAELIPFQTASGQSGHMTRAQRISLYLLSQRKQGLKHLISKNGGITMREKGTETAERILLTKGDIERICAEMSADERKIAKGLSVAMSHFAKWGNESSMKLYGYEKFGEKNYFPIRTDRNYRNTEIENAAPGEKGYRIKNAGMTKSTDSGATNPIILENAFDVFGRHASEMAKYHAFAPVLTDIDRIYNYQQWDAGTRGTSVKTALENKLGKAGTRYWEQLVGDINSGIQRERTPFSNMFSNFKAAKVGANLRVVIQQPLSYIRAGHMIDAKYLMEGLSGKTDVEIMEKYAPIARWKALGYSELDTGRQLSDMLRGKKETALEKVRAASMWAPGKADEITWKALWRAVEAETKATTELEPGTDAFYTAVGERFTEVIDRTQVVDTVLNRSGAMRNGGYGHQLGTMFMAEPTLDYNEIMANAKDVKAGKPGAVRQVVRCAKYMTVGAIAKAFVCSLVDAGRDKDEDETWTQKFVQAFWGAGGTEESKGEYISHVMSGNLAEGFNPMTWTPFLKDLVSLAQGYDRKSPDTALIADFYKSVRRLKDAANGEGKTALPAAAVQLLAKTADLSGLPLSNLEREVESMVNSLLLIPAVKDSAAGQQVQFTFRRFYTRLGADNIRDWVKWGNKNLTNEGMLRNFKDFLSKNELATEQDFRDAFAGGRSKELSTLVNDWKDAMREGNTDEADSLAKQMDTLGYSKKKVQNRLSAAEQALLKETWAVREKQSRHNVRITDKAAKSRQYRGMTLEQQEFFDARVRQYAGALALSEVDKSRKLEDFSTKWLAKARDAKTVGLTEDQFLVMWTITKDIEPMKTKDGKSIPNSRGLRIMQQIYKTFPGLSEKQYAYLFDGRNVPAKAMYTGSSKKHINNPARTEQELRKLQKKEGK